MDEITVAVLTVSDRCFKGEAIDESGPNLVHLINNGSIKNAKVVKTRLVSDSKVDISDALEEWCDEKIELILTTGGTGLASRDVTPEATLPLLEKVIPGISHLMFNRGLEMTPLSCLSRAVSGIRKESLIINLPGSKKASKECLEAVESVIPHAIDLIRGLKGRVHMVHEELQKKSSLVVVGKPVTRRRESPYPCVSVPEAQRMLLNKYGLLIKEKVIDYEEALDHVLAEDVYAADDLPPFDCSLKDGYAINSLDEMEIRDVVGVSCAGDSYPKLDNILSGSCVRVNTGAAIPPGADAVIEVENTEICNHEGEEEVQILLKKFPAKGQDIRQKGSDFLAGTLLLPYRAFLRPAALGLLAANGKTSVRVFVKPVVAIFSTGDELVNPRDTTKQYKVKDINRIVLLSLMKEENFSALDLGIVPDHPDALLNSLEKSFKTADVVVTTGSMSMGEKDYLKEVLIQDFNANIIFGRVLMKPGKPTACAEVTFEGKRKLWFGLPGNPVSALVTSQLFLLPTLRAISGRQKVFPSVVFAKYNKKVSLEDRPQYVRVELSYNNGCWSANDTGDQRSSRIGSCVEASGLLILPAIEQCHSRYNMLHDSSNLFETLLIDKIFI